MTWNETAVGEAHATTEVISGVPNTVTVTFNDAPERSVTAMRLMPPDGAGKNENVNRSDKGASEVNVVNEPAPLWTNALKTDTVVTTPMVLFLAKMMQEI